MILALVSGFLLGLSAALTPGPLMALIIAQSLQFGRREGIKIAVAPLLTDGPVLIASVWLLSGIPHRDFTLGLLSAAGSVFLLVMATSYFRNPAAGQRLRPTTNPSSLGKGMLVNFLSPYTYLFWFGIGAPVLLKVHEAHPAAPYLFLAVFYTVMIGANLAFALGSAQWGPLMKTRYYHYALRGLGLALGGFALMLGIEAVRRLAGCF